METPGTFSGVEGSFETWLLAAREGDTQSFGRAMEACRQYLMLVADRELDQTLRSKGGASDIVQQTFLDAQKDFERFAGQSRDDLRFWLVRILRNNLVSFVRRYRQTKRQAAREVPIGRDVGPTVSEESLVARTETPSGHAIRREQAHALTRVLDRLPERQRAIIQWRHREHCAFEEIGKRLGVSADAARMTWARAIRRLQKEIGDDSGAGVGGPPDVR